MELKLKNKKGIVTGSSSGIGESIAKCLAREGVHVMVQGRNESELQRVVNEITASGGVAHYVVGDLGNDEDALRVAKITLEKFQQVDILINNAGAYPIQEWLTSTPQDWQELFNVNVISMVRMINAFLPQMQTLGWGRIIQIASIAGIGPTASSPVYGTTKAANINMTESLSKFVAGKGITVNTVSPGPITTKGTQKLFTEVGREFNWGSEWAVIEKKVTHELLPNMLKRFGSAEEVGDLVTFLASPLADFITGVNYRIDGGRLV